MQWLNAPMSTAYTRFQLWWGGAVVGPALKVSGRMRLHLGGTLRIGRQVRMNSGWSNFVGGYKPMAIWTARGAEIHIGDRCALSNSTILAIQKIEILEETFIGGGCNIYDTDFHHIDVSRRLADAPGKPSAPIRIGPRAFVGGHSIILKGVTIGEGAVVGAGSVVTRDVPAGEIWAGVPARFIKHVQDSARSPVRIGTE
jgi:acetyltransferase-like isoleucine patch superfamily enzyme